MLRQIVGGVLLGLATCAGVCQTTQQSDPGPVQAELLANLDVRRLDSGKTFFARVTQDWKGQDCVLSKGATLEGKIEASVPRLDKNESKLALSFNQAQCNGREMQPLGLLLAAVAQPPTEWSTAPGAQSRMSMEFPNPRPSAGAATRAGASPALNNLYRPMDNFYTTHLELAGIDHRFPVRPGIKPGDVLGIKGLKLDMATGPNLSSVVSSKIRNVFLAEFTQILLVPAFFASRPASAHLASAGLASVRGDDGVVRTSPAAAAAIPSNDIEVCAPPGCAVDLPVNPKELQGNSGSSIATRPLGYTPRSNKVQAGFEDEESLAWLGTGHLLFAFNPHHLVRRGPTLNFSNTERVIRAVLLDTATRNIMRAVDWEIADSRRYLWPLDRDRILVHVGNELRVYGAGLEMERSIPLAGPLLFIRIAPNGALMAVATLRERHSPELHAQLRSDLGGDPQEDVDVSIFNQEFNTVAQVSTVSDLMPPTLLNEGQVKLQAEPGQWYRLAMSTWENQKIILARFRSLCAPEVTSAAPDLLFMLTCSAKDGDSEYSVLRPDGKVLLRGMSDPLAIGQEAAGNQGSRTFAVKVVRAEHTISPSSTFRSSELNSEEVRVYQAETGKRLLAVRVKEPVASHGGYALSPDGSQLAVLSGSDIEFFPLPPNNNPRRARHLGDRNNHQPRLGAPGLAFETWDPKLVRVVIFTPVRTPGCWAWTVREYAW